MGWTRTTVWGIGLSITSGLLTLLPTTASGSPAVKGREFNPLPLWGGLRGGRPSGDLGQREPHVAEGSAIASSPSGLPGIEAIAPPERLLSQTDLAPTRPDPDDRFLQPLPAPDPLPADAPSPLSPSPSPSPTPLPGDGTVTIPVQRVEVFGSTVFSEADLAPITATVAGQSVTLAQLQAVADRITQLYLENGYLTSRALLVDQLIDDGRVQIRVIEGSLERIDISGNERVNTAYIRRRIALGGRTPLSQRRLEDQLRLLRLDPLFENVEASLRAGTGLGQSILEVRVVEANPFFGEVSIDNYSNPTVGSERLGLVAGYRSPTGLGDEISASYYRSTTGGSNVFDVNYRLPVNAMNGTVQLRFSPSDYRITNAPADLVALDIEGNAEVYELSFRQPLVRSPREEFALSLGLTHRTGETLIAGLEIDATTTSVFRLGQDYVRRDPQGAWAMRSQFNLGTALLDATTGSEPNGQFFSWFGQLQRVQILSLNHLLIAQLDLQLSPDALPDAQQFVIGGGQSLRGYRQNLRSGDSGLRFSLEDRISIQRNESGIPTLQVAPFLDLGMVWNAADNPRDDPEDGFLAGLGLGIVWNPSDRLGVRLDATLPLIEIDDKGENAQDEGFYFSVNYRL